MHNKEENWGRNRREPSGVSFTLLPACEDTAAFAALTLPGNHEERKERENVWQHERVLVEQRHVDLCYQQIPPVDWDVCDRTDQPIAISAIWDWGDACVIFSDWRVVLVPRCCLVYKTPQVTVISTRCTPGVLIRERQQFWVDSPTFEFGKIGSSNSHVNTIYHNIEHAAGLSSWTISWVMVPCCSWGHSKISAL